MIDKSFLPIGSIFENMIIELVLSSKKHSVQLYQVRNPDLPKPQLLKIEKHPTGRLKNEIDILSQLTDFDYFPKLQLCSKSTDHLLYAEIHETLNDIIRIHKTIDISKLIKIFIEIISGLEILHKKYIIHGNICANNIFADLETGKIWIINFTESIDLKYISSSSAKIRNKNDLCCSFASLNSHIGLYNIKDDLESLGYLLVFTHTGMLPWKSFFPKGTFSKWQKVYIMKKSQSASQICLNCPRQFLEYFNYIHSLKEKDLIDYNYLKILLSSTIEHRKSLRYIDSKLIPKKISVKRAVSRPKTQKEPISKEKIKKLRSKSNLQSVEASQNLSELKRQDTITTNAFPEFKDRSIIEKSRQSLLLPAAHKQDISEVKTCILI